MGIGPSEYYPKSCSFSIKQQRSPSFRRGTFAWDRRSGSKLTTTKQNGHIAPLYTGLVGVGSKVAADLRKMQKGPTRGGPTLSVASKEVVLLVVADFDDLQSVEVMENVRTLVGFGVGIDPIQTFVKFSVELHVVGIR